MTQTPPEGGVVHTAADVRRVLKGRKGYVMVAGTDGDWVKATQVDICWLVERSGRAEFYVSDHDRNSVRFDFFNHDTESDCCLLYTSPSPRD